MSNRKVIVYIAASLDRYISKPNDDMSFLDKVHLEGEDYGYFDFINSIDTVILGRKTYDWVMTQVPDFPHSDKTTYVISRTFKPSLPNLHFYSGDIKKLVDELKESGGKNIFCDGGADVVNTLLNLDLVDE